MKKIVTDFSGTMKLGTHKDKGLMYRVKRNQEQGRITLGIKYLDRFYNLPLMKNFRYRFSGTMKAIKLKLGSHLDNGLMYRVDRKQGQRPITLGVTSLDTFYYLPLLKKIVTDISGTRKAVKLKFGTHIHTWTMGWCIVYTRIRYKGVVISPW